MSEYGRPDRLDCLMVMAEKLGYGPHYGEFAANHTDAQLDALEAEGRMHIQRKRQIREMAARKRMKHMPGKE